VDAKFLKLSGLFKRKKVERIGPEEISEIRAIIKVRDLEEVKRRYACQKDYRLVYIYDGVEYTDSRNLLRKLEIDGIIQTKVIGYTLEDELDIAGVHCWIADDCVAIWSMITDSKSLKKHEEKVRKVREELSRTGLLEEINCEMLVKSSCKI